MRGVMALAFLVGCGQPVYPVACGEGTTLVEGQCVPLDDVLDGTQDLGSSDPGATDPPDTEGTDGPGNEPTGTDDTDDTDQGMGPFVLHSNQVLVSSVSLYCNAPGDWVFASDLDLTSTRAVANIWNTGAGNDQGEEHLMVVVDTDPNGAWEAIEGVYREDAVYMPDLASGFRCEDIDVLTYAIRVYDDTGQISDCALWGHDPAAVVGGLADYSEVSESGELLACDIWS